MLAKITGVLVLVFALVACGHQVTQRLPDAAPLRASDTLVGYARELLATEMPPYLDDDSRKSPDGTLSLEATGDRDYRDRPTGYFGLVLKNLATGAGRPVLSLWEADAGSGLQVSARWSADSRVIRLKGSTRGFQRSGGAFQRFDLLYSVDLDRFFDLRGSFEQISNFAAPSNNPLKLTARGRSGAGGWRRSRAAA